MAVWSSLTSKNFRKLDFAKNIFFSFRNECKGKGNNYVPLRTCHEKTIEIRPSVFTTLKVKDLIYFYLTIGSLPLLAIVIYTNVFIGPATLALIPEGYEPQKWEYFRHPITRFFSKYITVGYQESYERTLHNIYVQCEMRKIHKLENKVHRLMKEKQDYQAWYYEAPQTKYIKDMRAKSDKHRNEDTVTSNLAKI